MTQSIAPVAALTVTMPAATGTAGSIGSAGDIGRGTVISWNELVERHSAMAGPAGNRGVSFDPATLGDRILASVQGMREDYQRMVGDAQNMLKPGPAEGALTASSENVISHEVATSQAIDPHATAIDEIRGMLAMQLDMGRLMVHEQLMSSTAGRGNRSLDTLLRGQ
ncbi:MAG: hypothetical protein H6851_01475 [Geminicoccaceae bacterium]|nr:hypothetical protein [Geminicoccaceae bacterium]MCB9942280.1 hypothetical protein [Geminicoccaceae bacterium]